jgi:5,6,7,8-tetrahydromethanopterin hydro-lyase
VTDDPLDGRIGEAWSGEAPNGAHINVVVGRRGSATGAAIAASLAAARPGHLPFLACLRLGEVVRPTTVIVNKSTIENDAAGRMTWGAAQLGVAQGVLDAVADGVVDPADAAELVLLVPVWVDPAAVDETAVRTANRAATRAAIENAVCPPSPDEVRALAKRREEAINAYYGGT